MACSGAWAQTAPNSTVPPTREEVARPIPGTTDRAAVAVEVEGEFQAAPCALDRAEYRDIRVPLREVRFTGLREVPADALRPAYADHVGRSIPVVAICAIRDRAAAILAEAGYVVAIEVPEQRIADGQLTFNIVMARLTGLQVRGDGGRSERLIAAYLRRLTEREVFNRHEAERYLLLAGDVPGYSVRLSLRSAGAARGEVIGEVIVRRLPALVDLTIQNLGSSELGSWGALLRAQVFGLTGLGDRTTVAAFVTPDAEEQRTLQIAHDFRMGGEGFSLGGQATFAWARPDLGDPAIDIRSRTLFVNLEASYPFVRSVRRSLFGLAGIDIVNQDVNFSGLPLNRDRLRVAYVRLAAEASGVSHVATRLGLAEPPWRLGASIEARHGVDIMGATEPCGPLLTGCAGAGVVPPSRLEANPTAFVLRGSFDFDWRPVRLVTLAGSIRAQQSGDPLLSFEEFSAGNYTIGRGYDPGSILGDSGVALRGELRVGRAIPRRRDELVVQPFVFFDQAWAWNEDRLLAVPRQELTSIGGGVRAAYGDRLRLELLFTAPLDRTLLQPRRDPRLLLSITARLWPWSVL